MCHAAQLCPNSLERAGKAETLSHPTRAMISQLNRCRAVEERKLRFIYFFKARGLKLVSFFGCNFSFANALSSPLLCEPVTRQSHALWTAGRLLAQLKPLSTASGVPFFTLGFST